MTARYRRYIRNDSPSAASDLRWTGAARAALLLASISEYVDGQTLTSREKAGDDVDARRQVGAQ